MIEGHLAECAAVAASVAVTSVEARGRLRGRKGSSETAETDQ